MFAGLYFSSLASSGWRSDTFQICTSYPWTSVFKWATSLWDTLTSSHYSTTSDRPPRSTWGTYQCGRCSLCPLVTEGRGIRLPNGQWHQSRCYGYADCSTRGVIYLITCKCCAFYIGKTIHEFGQRIRDHVCSSESGRMTTSVARHIGLHHRFNNSLVPFFVLEVIPPKPRGGYWDNMILRAETLMIERL